MNTARLHALAAGLAATLGWMGAAQADDGCARLTALTIPDLAVIEAAAVDASTFKPPYGPEFALPAHCRVRATATPTPVSKIGIEVWLPLEAGWNGKLLGTANGGFSGAVPHAAMAVGLARGYAVAGTDTGHEGDQLEFGRGAPERIEDWGHRAVHLMTTTARLAVRSHYGRFPRHAYFDGCSTGGQQALSEVQRYPLDYDGVVAGAPGHNRSRLIHGFLWGWQALHDGEGQPLLPQAKLAHITRQVLAQCDARDGRSDGRIEDPRQCDFDPARMQCEAGDREDCLTAVQVDAVRKVYDGARNPRTGERIFAGWTRGTEAGWGAYLLSPEPARLGFYRHFAFHDPNWHWRSFDWDRDIAHIDRTLPFVDATSPDLSAFHARGGKLLMYTGWDDPVVPAQDTIDYHDAVRATLGDARADEFLRLFVVPGMGHCGFGPVPVQYDALALLERWVEQGQAPERMDVRYHHRNAEPEAATICPWPQRGLRSGETGQCLAPAANARKARRP